MKKLTTLIFLLLFVNAFSQNTYRVEYFIDNDNGYEANPYVDVTNGDDFVFNKTVNLNGVNTGLHTLFVRVKNENSNWSSTLISHFICTDMHNWNLVEAEYFFDIDPGYGNAKKLSTSGNDFLLKETLNLDGIEDGLHTLYIRAKDEKGNWSTTHMSHFISKTVSKWKVIDLEYFIDNDPGAGMANKIDFEKGKKDFVVTKNINLDNITDGLHTLFIRAKDENNNWSSLLISHFVCLDPSNWKIEDLEFYIDDNDPGYGEANKITITRSSKIVLDFNVDLNNYDIGMHTISIRAKRHLGTWSRDYIFNFEIKEDLALVDFSNKNLLAYPSPTTGLFSMDLKSPQTNVDMIVTDLSGRVVSEKYYGKTDRITGKLIGNSGVYIIYILSKDKVIKIFKIEKI